ncbi:Shieldin complex subunit 2 [Geodia barretti]|nr:Shieldin complex subunit 2 [Geodia barretti]
MFSTEEDAGRISPPQKRARTLDIADVACLVTRRQRAAFPSPEKPSRSSVFSLSSDTAAPLSTTTVKETQDEFSQELIEEDTVIQSSLPHYLSHVYGGGRHSDPDDSGASSSTSCCSVSTASCSSKLSPPAIVESQGFTVTEISDQPNGTNIESDAPCAAMAGSSNNTQSSPLLFDSPTSLPRSSPTHAKPNISTAADQQPSVSHPQTVAAKPCTLSTTKSELKENVADSGDWVKKRPSRKRKFSAGTKAEKLNYTCPPSCVNLAECAAMKPESLVHLFALVLQVNSVMEVACKKGQLAGSTVPVASLLLADPTRSCLKLLLWREAASWVERITAGDIVFLKSLRLKRWQGETVAHTIMYSRVLNLHQPKKSLPQKFVTVVPAGSLESLVEWGKSRHGYLFRDTHPLPSSQRPVHFRSSDQLGVESVVHFRAKLTSVISERVFLFSDRPGKDVCLYL